MNKQEMLDLLSEKKRLTAPVATAENNERVARQKYEKVRKKWKPGIVVSMIMLILYILYLLSTGDWRLFFYSKSHTIQAGGLGGIVLFGGILFLLLYLKHLCYIKPAEKKLAEAQSILNQEKSNPYYINSSINFPAKFYNYYDLFRLWNIINEERAESLKEAYNLLETQQFQQNQIAIQEDIRRLQQETATSSKAAAAASVVTAYNTAKTARRLK